MSGDWIKIEVCLPDKPEVWAMSESLDLDPDTVVGKLIRVWSWFDAHTNDGHAKRVTCHMIDRVTLHPGFAKAMIDVGWLDDSDAGLMQPNFEKHNGESAKKRAEAALRQAKHRKRKLETDENPRNAKSVTKVLPEKRREDIYKGDTPEWINPEIWHEFETHRKEIKAKLTPTATKRLIANLDTYRKKGADPNEALRQSIANQWRGVFPERLLEKANGKTQHRAYESAVQRRNREAREAIECAGCP